MGRYGRCWQEIIPQEGRILSGTRRNDLAALFPLSKQ